MTAAPAPADTLLRSLPRNTLVVGKGGVGKTTCAAGIAADLAALGFSTLVVSTDPAAALGTVLDAPAGDDATPVEGVPRLSARQLATGQLRSEFMDHWRDVIAEIVDRGTYLDRDDITGLVDSAMPGADEVFALLALADLFQSSIYERIVVDTAPTGHTLRLLQLPDTFAAVVTLLDAMQEKHRFMVSALTHRYRPDRADAFLSEMRARADALRAALADPVQVAAVLITRSDPVVAAESARYAARLREMGIAIAATITNAVTGSADTRAGLDSGSPSFSLPKLEPPPRNAMEAGALVLRLTRVAIHADSRRASVSPGVRENSPSHAGPAAAHITGDQLAQPLTIVGGKGGVGKTTVACALAIELARPDAPVLLVSTDPAPSIADALGEPNAHWTRQDLEHAIPDVPGLAVRQMDAAAAFARIREQYERQVDAVFDAIVARGVDAAADRAIVRDLLALAPPGIDEVYALAILGDALAENRFARIVVDPAPTGHLLRLLEMPALAVDWTHRLLRLMLKYKELTGLGDTTSELLAFARRTRALQDLLHDSNRAGLLLVALDEPVVRAETERLARLVPEHGVSLLGILWNQTPASAMTIEHVFPLPSSRSARQFCAPVVSPPPTGIIALRAWQRQWRSL